MKHAIPLLLFCFLPATIQGQDLNEPFKFPSINDGIEANRQPQASREEMLGRAGFRRAVAIGSRKLVRSGELTRWEAIQIRSHLVMPAFADVCESVAVSQMYYSGAGEFPAEAINEDGTVNREKIDWDRFGAFLSWFIPFILELIKGLG